MAVNNNLNSNITRTSVSDSDKVSSLVTLSPDYLQNRHYRIRHNPIPSDFDNHRYEALEFILCTGGEYSVKISEQSFRMKKGDILFIPPSSSRQFQVQENGELFFLIRQFSTRFHASRQFFRFILPCIFFRCLPKTIFTLSCIPLLCK